MAGTITVTHSEPVKSVGHIRFACTADASTGSFPSTAVPAFEGWLLALHTDPGATAPTTLYDIAANDGLGLDRLQGVGANRSASASEQVPVIYSGTAIHPPVKWGDGLTLAITNNSVNSALVTIDLYYSS